MKCDILITNCSVLSSDFDILDDVSIAINDTNIVEMGKGENLRAKYEPKEVISDRNKLVMPGLVDAHTHSCQQLLRGRTMDEYPMIWARILVPFESSLYEEDVYYSTKLSCLEMIKSGTTAFADSGGVHMHKVAEAAIESGMRAAIARSTMDTGAFIPASMKDTPEEAVSKTEKLYRQYHGEGDSRIKIWFAVRQVMTCTEKLIAMVADKAKELHTGVHAHLAEHKDEVSFCLQNYKKRPPEFLDSVGLLGPNLLTAHNVLLSEGDITLLKERNVKLVHCPRSNFGSHGFPKTPRMLEAGLSLGLGSDGAAGSSLSLFDEMKVFRSGIHAFWGLPVFDPVVLKATDLMKMATLGGAKALLLDEAGTIEVGKKADLILIDLDQPHLAPTHNLVNTIVECATGKDVTDSIIDGRVVMRNREVNTLDEEKIIYECKQRMTAISKRAGI